MAITTAYISALLAALFFPEHQVGLNLLIVWGFLAASGWLTARSERWGGTLVLLSLLPASMVVLRSAPWLLVLEALAVVGVAAVGVSGAVDWRGMVRPAGLVSRLPRGLGIMLTPAEEWLSDAGERHGRRVFRSAGLIGCVLLVFGGLFVSADAAFATIAEDWLVPHIGLSSVMARVIIFGCVIALAGALLSLARARELAPLVVATGEKRDGGWLRVADWRPALIALNFLFAAFVVVQVAVLFGGRSHVLATSGLTYAEYARQGFFQLVAVAAFTLVVVAVVVGSCRTSSDRTWARVLLGALCLLTIVILVSAAKRMDLYQLTYGATRLRLTVDLIIWWLAAIFVLVLGAGVRWSGTWLPRAAVVVSLIALVAFGLSNPDGRIAEKNVDRYLATGRIDLVYLRGLSTDALPALMHLPEPQRSCAIAPIVGRAEDPSLWSFNLSRRAASDVQVGPTDPECAMELAHRHRVPAPLGISDPVPSLP